VKQYGFCTPFANKTFPTDPEERVCVKAAAFIRSILSFWLKVVYKRIEAKPQRKKNVVASGGMGIPKVPDPNETVFGDP
jgi:hypothetical protein